MYLGQFDRLTKLGAKWAKKFVSTKSRRNFSQRTHPIHPIASKTHVLARFEQFGCILNNLVCLRNSVPLDPKLMFWCVSYYLGAFGTVWLPYETRSKTGRTSAKVRNRKSRRNFSQRTHPFHPIGPQTHVLAHFVLFGCIWDNCLPYETRCKMDRTSAKSSFPRSRIEIFRNERTLSHCILKLCFGVFCTIWVHLG